MNSSALGSLTRNTWVTYHSQDKSGGLCLPEHEHIKMHFPFLFLASQQGMWDLSSPAEIEPMSLTEDTHNLNHWTAGSSRCTFPKCLPHSSPQKRRHPLLGSPGEKSLIRTDCFISQAAASTEGRWGTGGGVGADLKGYLDFI